MWNDESFLGNDELDDLPRENNKNLLDILEEYGTEREKQPEYYYCGLFSWHQNSYSKQEKLAAIFKLEQLLKEKPVNAFSLREAGALRQGDLAVRIYKAGYNKLVEAYIQNNSIDSCKISYGHK